MSQKLLDNLELFKGSLETTGCLITACTIADVSLKIVLNFKKESSEFKQLVDDAIDYYRESQQLTWEPLSIRFTTNLLKGNVTKRSVVRRYILPKNENSDESDTYDSGGIIEVYREEKEEIILPPKWLLERFLPEKEQKPIEVVVDFGSNSPDKIDLSLPDPEVKRLED